MGSIQIEYDDKLKEAIGIYMASNGLPNYKVAIIDSLRTFYGIKTDPNSAIPATPSRGKHTDLDSSTKTPEISTISSQSDIDTACNKVLPTLKSVYKTNLTKELSIRGKFSIKMEGQRIIIIK